MIASMDPADVEDLAKPRRWLHPVLRGASVVAGICLILSPGAPGLPRSESRTAAGKGAVMSNRASGTFEVKLTPQAAAGDAEGRERLGRMSIDKRFLGDLEGISKGEMLTAGTDVDGSAGYVAIERVTGTLKGRTGSFVLQHSGTMTRGAPQLTITVVPDSGTGELAGLTGKMGIRIADGKHFYDLEYTVGRRP